MKIAIVTGASQGLGQIIADAFLTAGWHVIGTGRSSRPEVLNPQIEYKQFDASDESAAANFWQEIKDQEGVKQICLVNNAGGYISGSLIETAPKDYERQIQSNYFAGVYMTHGLIAHVSTARIFNIISTSALTPHKNDSAYGAAKAASMHFFQSIQQELDSEKYQITNLYPSDIATHGENPNAINPTDLADLIVELAESQTSYYPTDITLYPVKRKL